MELFDIVPLKEDIESLPSPTIPHFIAAKEGIYLRKNNALGECLILQKEMPKHLKSVGEEFKKGGFWISCPIIPTTIMSQAVDFFSKVFERYKTEAEVLILLNSEKQEYKLFVPIQTNSSASVKSIYDAADIKKGWQVVGTMHSHCDFSAFHSSTDINDASSFNGMHITVGHVDKENPEFDVMVMIDGTTFTFSNDDQVIDISDLHAMDCPEYWFKFLEPDPKAITQERFKTLSADDIKAFSKPEYTYKPTDTNKGFTSWGDNSYANVWDDDSDYSWGRFNDSRYYGALGIWVPKHWFAFNNDLKEEFYEDALRQAIDSISKKALRQGYYVVYEVLDADKEAPFQVLEGDFSPSSGRRAGSNYPLLLPGAFEVKEVN